MCRRFAVLLPALLIAVLATAAEPEKLPLVYQSNFTNGAKEWKPTDLAAWQIVETDKGAVYGQVKQSKYKPPHRSPLNISLIKDLIVGDFVLEAKVKSTIKDYNHRDVCLFFGYQDPAHFYYVHLGKKTDDHANQIFIVNNAPRTKISLTTTAGTPWNDEWHNLKVVRTVKDGRIEVYYDDMKKPVMTAKDDTFTWGQVGVGSFDDTAYWLDVRVHGQKVNKP